MKQPIILIIEDEVPIRDMLRFSLEPSGFKIIEAENTKTATQSIAQQLPDLILLDWMLPGISGIEFAKQLKQKATTQNIPIIMLTAKAEEINKITGLETGADDYITKPFSPRELIARIKAVLRRGALVAPNGNIQVGKLQINVHTREVIVDQSLLNLTPSEYRLLHFFVTHPNRVYSRSELLDYVWGNDKYIDDRTVDVQIRRLRQRLKPFSYDKLIKTARQAGYQFSDKIA